MNDTLRLVLIQAQGAWRYRWVGVAVAWVVGIGSAVGMQAFRDRYEAVTRVHVNTQTVLKPLMAQLAMQPDIDLQVRMLARTLISRPRVEKLLETLEFPQERLGERARETLIGDLVSAIRLEGSPQGNLYTISYRDNDPVRARQLVHTLVGLFVDSGTVSKKHDSQQAREFIDAQIADYEKKLTEAENRLKEFKVRNFGMSGATNQDFFARMAGISDEVNRLRLELNAAEQSRDALKRELSSENPQLPAEALPSRQQALPSELETRLESYRRQLDELLRRYTDEHPEVIAARRNIAALERQRKDEVEKVASSGGLAPTNPVFQQLRVSLAQAEAQVASLRSQLAVQQSRLDGVRGQATRMPQVEAELAQLNRDYEVVRRAYQQLVERREAASLGIKLDDSSQLADFRIIEPPAVSSKPVFPSKAVLSMGAVATAIAAGLAAMFCMGLLFPAVFDERQLQALTKRPVLGGVSAFKTAATRRAARWQLAGLASTAGLFLAASLSWVGWVFMGSRL